MKEKNSDSSQKSSTPKVKITNTESFSSFNSNSSTNEKDNNYLKMNAIIQTIMDYQTPNDGKIKDDEISFLIKKSLYEINKKIYNILDFNNNSFLHILVKNSNYYPLKIICNTYYILLDDENLFFKWFLLENNENLTAMDIASTIGNKKILSYLFSVLSKANKSILRFDDINNKKNTIFHYSAKSNKYFSILFWYEKLQRYFPKTKIFDTKNAHNLTPLHYACYDNSFECVQLLIDLGADVNAVDINGKSVLTYAINSNNIKIIELLILNGADFNIKDLDRKTAYEYSRNICDKNIQYILNKKLKINLVNNNKNSFEIIQFLLFFFFFIFLFLLYSFASFIIEF
jgi:ankyrin repeat protein